MFENKRNIIAEEIANSLDIPDSAYEKAETRYKDLGEWFGRKEAHCANFEPHIYPQGSFRLGTVIRPLDEKGEYDLDFGCRLRRDITKKTHTQHDLKMLIRADIESYRIARGIQEKIEEKHRCWRLQYADTLKFHMDIVPSIPESIVERKSIKEAMIRAGTSADLAQLVADMTGAITDDRMWNYRIIDDAWRVSNSEGFAKWFESRINLAKSLQEKRILEAKQAKIDDLPTYKWKSPLQRCVQILKHHRDNMFPDDPDGKPSSIIITTLSAHAYKGEIEIGDALNTILSTMEHFINTTVPRIPNPINPDNEDFTDRWTDPAYYKNNLERKFWLWLGQAQEDFRTVGNEHEPRTIVEKTKLKFGITLNEKNLAIKLGNDNSNRLLKPAVAPTPLSFPDRPIIPKKPAGFASNG